MAFRLPSYFIRLIWTVIPKRMILLLFLLLADTASLYAATFNVSFNNDTNDGVPPYSLRDAVLASNLTPTSDTILLPAGTFSLSLGPADPSGKGPASFVPGTGDLDISAPVTIQGSGPAATIIDGQNLDRIFDSHGASVTLRDLTLRRGNAPAGLPGEGGAVLLRGTDSAGAKIGGRKLSLINCRVINNNAGMNGGAVGVRSTIGTTNLLTATKCVFTSNTAGDGGGALCLIGSPANLKTSTFTLNRANTIAQLGFGGGAVQANMGSGNRLTMDRCTFTSNTSVFDGGAIAHESGDLQTTGSALLGNRANRNGGGYSRTSVLNGQTLNTSFIGTDVTGNRADADMNASGSGGGFYNAASAMTSALNIAFTRLTGNLANSGDDLYVTGTGVATVARNNWWGTNLVPTTTLNAGGAPPIALTPRLLLSLAIAQTTIPFAGQTQLTASLNANSFSVVVGGVYPNHVPNTTPVHAWLGEEGTSSGADLFTAGNAQGLFVASGGPDGVAGVKVDNQVVTGSITILAETTPPVVSNMIRLTPPYQYTSAAQVVWRVTFSESVSGVAANDFTFNKVPGGTTLAGYFVVSVTPVNASVYDIAVNTGTGTGGLRLSVPAAATIFDLANNDYNSDYFTGPIYSLRTGAAASGWELLE